MALDAKTLERKLEEQVAKLPVDTPLDRRRRHRRARTAGRAVVVLLALGAVAALLWRRQQRAASFVRADHAPAEAGPAPDVFGSAVDRAEPVAASLR